jgi:uncharacterized protein (DUF885 family)/cyclophilin family peptidyl-prolyl cis-trans isomerase
MGQIGKDSVPTPRVRVVTDAGDLLIELYLDRAPLSAAAFLSQVDAGAYDGGEFGRAVRFDNDQGMPQIEVIQAGVATANGLAITVEHEPTSSTGLSHLDGAVSLPRQSGGDGSPLSFFVSIGRQPALDCGGGRTADGLGFAVFGRVCAGMEVARAIQASATLLDAPHPYLKGQIIAEPVAIHIIRREAAKPSILLRDLAQDYWAFRVREYPLEASAAGVRSAGRLLDRGRGVDHERRTRLCSAMLERACEIDAHGLSAEDGASLSMLTLQLEAQVTGYDLGAHLVPQLFPFGFADVPGQLAQSTPLNSIQDLEDFFARLLIAPEFLEEHWASLRSALASGYRVPRDLIPRILGLIDANLAETGLARLISTRTAGVNAGRNPAPVNDLRHRIDEVVSTRLIPTLRALRQTVANLDPEYLTASASISDQPRGRDYYLFKVRQQTTTDLSPDEIHAFGLEEVARIEHTLDGVAARIQPAGGRKEVAAALGDRVAADGEALLNYVRATAKKIDGLLPRVIGHMPRISYAVEPLTPEQSLDLPPAFAQPAPADRSMPGVFWLTALAERCPLHLVAPLTLHEAWPGHLMQFAIAHELGHLPAFRRYGWTDYNSYIEGWALYCEQLGHDLGLYGRSEDHFGQLSFDLWRAARLVVDTGLHWLGWSRGQAINYMAEHTFLPHETIESEIDRYIGMPAQALSYKIGERSIRGLRLQAEQTLGSRFSLREFHRVVLEVGPVPLSVLEAHVQLWFRDL